MLDWPATPDKGKGKATIPSASASSASRRVAVPKIDTRNLGASKINLSFIADPSPASTYGETASTASVPQTPAEENDPSTLNRPLEALQLANYEENPIEAKYGENASLFTPSKEKCLPPTYCIPGGSGTKEKPSPRKRVTFTRRSSVDDGSTAEKQAELRIGFVKSENEEDPFTTDENKGPSSRDELAGSAVTTPAKTSSVGTPTSKKMFRPREDREVTEISGDNAQALLPPNACVFVANLVQSRADDQLEHSVARAFEQFGKVYVKIKRDPRGMPYAFCQYENISDSEKAIQHGRGVMIDGRQCRTERAKVNRSLYLTKVVGGEITEDDAREVLAGRGDLEKLWHSSATDKEMYRLPDGIWVTFAFFQDCRDAQALFKDSPHYRLEQPLLAEDARVRFNRVIPSPTARVTPGRAMPVEEHTTVFVGGLPLNVTQTQLRTLFAHCGVVRALEIISRPMVHVNSFNVFAFIEFCEEKEARKAVNGEHILEGLHLRVELRDSTDNTSPFADGQYSGSPRPRKGPATETRGTVINRDVAMARALAAGVHPATAMQIFEPQPLGSGEPTSNPIAFSPPVYAQMAYHGSYYGQPYSPYGSPVPTSGSDIDPAAAHMYGSPSPMHPGMGSYQYPPLPAGQYYASVAPMAPYVYAQPSDANTSHPQGGLSGYATQ